MKASEIYPPSLLNVAQVSEKGLWEKPMTINTTEMREFTDKDTNKVSKKIVLGFRETDAKLGLNATNGKTLIKLFGDSTLNWEGKAIKLVRVRVLYRGQQVESIGVEAA